MINKINEVMKNFGISGEFKSYKIFNSGHINTTCMIVVDDNGIEKKYVMQKINTNVFKRPVEVMENISNVTTFIKNKYEQLGCNASRSVLNFHKTQNGYNYTIDNNGDYWRLYDYIDNSITYDEADCKILYETGKAFGEFQKTLSDYPIEDLYDTIPNFHNTPKRYESFKKVLENDPMGRAQGVRDEIESYSNLEELVSQMQHKVEAGMLPIRVTHNDTKCNNVLFDKDTHKYLCVIDLDTVMPGLVGFDFGDAMRFASNTRAEDSTDLENVKVDMEKFEAFTRGFVEIVGKSLTKEEIDTLVLGAITMTTECGLRFLTDYIDGDNYFKTNYPNHNLDRARCQLKLALNMIEHRKEMQECVDKCVNNMDFAK